MEKWHDLRENPEDLPEKGDFCWVVCKDLDGKPTVEVDNFYPEDKGKIVEQPDGSTFVLSGWWSNVEDGAVTHWMHMDVPELPEM